MLKHRVGIEEIFQKSIQCLACTRPWFNPQYQERKKEKSFFLEVKNEERNPIKSIGSK